MTNEIKVEGGDTKIETIEETKVETTEEKVEETEESERQEASEAKRARVEGSLKRMAKDLRELGGDPESLLGIKKTEKTSKKSNDLDFGEKAFLISNGIKGEEMEFVKGLSKRTGLSLDEAVTDDYVQLKLKSYREERASERAVPSGTKRSSGSAKDSVEHHLEKYENGTQELMDMPFDMRAKVLTAKIDKEKKKSQFSFTPNI